MTNMEYIHSCSKEELARKICKSLNPYTTRRCDCTANNADCGMFKGYIKWLEAEVKEGDAE